jgi:hypothetical protein
MAGPQYRRPLRQGPVHPRLRRRTADLPGRSGHAVRARPHRALPQGHLRGLPAAAALRGQQPRAQRLHPDEALLAELRQRQQSPEGRAKLRERVAVEHALAYVGHWQGRRARYLGTRKNLFDLRWVAVVHNLHITGRQPVAGDYQPAA